MIYTDEQVRAMNRTARSGGAIGGNALVPKIVRRICAGLPEAPRILDFGAGPRARHALDLMADGLDVTATEIGGNVDPALHRQPEGDYDIVYASNVLNVQPSRDTIAFVIGTLRALCRDGGHVVVNYPLSPRKAAVSVGEIQGLLAEAFDEVRRDGVAFLCRRCRR